MKKNRFTLFLLLALLLISFKASYARSKKTVIGRIEWIEIPSLNIRTKARIDTGAQTCSMHAIDIKTVHIEGEPYIEFTYINKYDKEVRQRKRIIKKMRVRGSTGILVSRYYISDIVKLGGVTKKILISLNDRSSHKYKFLVGRNFLRGKFLVDVSRSHVKGD